MIEKKNPIDHVNAPVIASYKTYDNIRSKQLTKRGVLKEHHIGGKWTLWINGHSTISYVEDANLSLGIPSKSFGRFFGLFVKNLYGILRKNEELFLLDIPSTGKPISTKNIKSWNSIELGSELYYIDISSAYWQIGYKLGYITKKSYHRYIDEIDYKIAKRLVFTFLARENRMVITTPEGSTVILCDNSCLERVYSNVRNELYHTIQKALKTIDNNYIQYNVDAIMVAEIDDLLSLVNYFQSIGLLFSVKQLIKISQSEMQNISTEKIIKFKQ